MAADREVENGPGLNGSSTRLIFQKLAVSHFSLSGRTQGTPLFSSELKSVRQQACFTCRFFLQMDAVESKPCDLATGWLAKRDSSGAGVLGNEKMHDSVSWLR